MADIESKVPDIGGHGDVPVKASKHASTGKSIAPLAPAFNAERFTATCRSSKSWSRSATR